MYRRLVSMLIKLWSEVKRLYATEEHDDVLKFVDTFSSRIDALDFCKNLHRLYRNRTMQANVFQDKHGLWVSNVKLFRLVD